MEHDILKIHGAFSWNELMTTDVRGAKKFYSELLDWTFNEINSADKDYTMITVGDREVGGMMSMPPEAQGMPPAWGSYVTVKNVDALTERVEKLGGKILLPAQNIPNVGRFMVIQDPQGAVLSLIAYINKN